MWIIHGLKRDSTHCQRGHGLAAWVDHEGVCSLGEALPSQAAEHLVHNHTTFQCTELSMQHDNKAFNAFIRMHLAIQLSTVISLVHISSFSLRITYMIMEENTGNDPMQYTIKLPYVIHSCRCFTHWEPSSLQIALKSVHESTS